MKAQEIMTAGPACCTPDDTAQEAARLMEENDCGCVPVVADQESRRLAGVVTDRDIALRGVGRGRGAETKVSDLMSTDVSCCGPDSDVEEVERIMAERQVRRVPVLDDDGCCVGAELAERLGDALFTGHLDGEELGRAVASADILLNPSVTETFGNVYLEAMAAGLCVVSANTPNAAELIEHGVSGYLCPLDPVAFAAVIGGLAKDSGRRRAISVNAAAAASEYRWPQILDSVVNAYAELVAIPCPGAIERG